MHRPNDGNGAGAGAPSSSPRADVRILVASPPEEGSQSLNKNGDKNYIAGVTILADGNRRYGDALGIEKESDTYDLGGANVVAVAESTLLNNPNLSTFMALVLSQDNVDKRPAGFFHSVTHAFKKLGIAIQAKGVLGSKGIKLHCIHDDLQDFRHKAMKALRSSDDAEKAKGSAMIELLDTIEAVSAMNDEHLKKWQDEQEQGVTYQYLVLGINYNPSITNPEKEYGIKNDGLRLVIRTGTDMPGGARYGSADVTGDNTLLASTPVLWPEFKAEQLQGMINDARHYQTPDFKVGLSLSTIAEIIDGLALGGQSKRVEITIPFDGYRPNIEGVFNRVSGVMTSGGIPVAVTYSYDGIYQNTQHQGGPDPGEAQVIVHIVPGSTIGNVQGDFDYVILPGQEQSSIKKFPSEPDPGYANIVPCANNPESIIRAIANAVEFNLQYKPLHGAERPSPSKELNKTPLNEPIDPTLMPEFSKFFSMVNAFIKPSLDVSTKSSSSPEKLAGILNGILENDRENITGEKYNELADRFIQNMMVWVESLNIPWTRDIQFRALLNYLITSFFLSVYPKDNDSKVLVEGFAKPATHDARYMTLVYLMDEMIFDFKIEDQNVKQKFIDFATTQLQRAVRGEKFEEAPADLLPPDNADMLKVFNTLVKEFALLAQDQKREAEGAPRNFNKWQSTAIGVFECHRGEWNEDIVKGTLVDQLAEDYDGNIREFQKRYAKAEMSSFLKEKMAPHLETLKTSTSPEARREAVHHLKLWAYECDIENSIGSALVYRTIACVDTPDFEDPAMESDYEELCLLINVFFRLANDAAEMNRDPDDMEGNVDSVHIMAQRYLKETEGKTLSQKEKIKALLSAQGDIYLVVKELEKVIKVKRAAFLEKTKGKPWEKLAMAIIRSDFGTWYYTDGHYRTKGRGVVAKYLKANHALGTNQDGLKH